MSNHGRHPRQRCRRDGSLPFDDRRASGGSTRRLRQRSVTCFDSALPADPTPPAAVLDDLVAAADPGITATVGPRYFGFVIGGALPAATAADMMALGWDQIAFNATLSPASIAAEQVAGRWAKELLGIPASASVGFVTGAQEANTVGLAAARHHVLAEARVGRRAGRPPGSATGSGRRRGRAAQHHRPIAPAAGAGRQLGRPGADGRQRRDRRRAPRGGPCRDGRADHRLSAVGQREHRRLRRPRTSLCRRARP